MDAALLASANETDEGSLRNLLAVLRAACFCAHVVPSVEFLEGSAEALLIVGKRDRNPSPTGDFGDDSAGLGAMADEEDDA